MSLFFVAALPGSETAVEAALKEKFPSEIYQIGPDKWFVSAELITAKAVSEKLGLVPGLAGRGCIVVSVAGYFGVAPPDIWEWLAAKVAKPNG